MFDSSCFAISQEADTTCYVNVLATIEHDHGEHGDTITSLFQRSSSAECSPCPAWAHRSRSRLSSKRSLLQHTTQYLPGRRPRNCVDYFEVPNLLVTRHTLSNE